MSNWLGKTAIVTGAGTGIGKAVSKELASRGVIVYVTALTQGEAQAVVDEIFAAGGEAIAAQVDVTVHADVQGIIARVASERGRLDLMVNNAGLLYVGEFLEMDEAFIEKLVQVNVTGVMIGTLYAYRQMKQQGSGLIVNVASQGGLMPVATMAAYSSTKHAVIGLSESVAGEAAAFGVDIKTVCPGNVASEMLTRARTRGIDAQGVLDVLPEAMPTDVAARIIVDGFGSTKHKIILPWYSRVLGLLVRIWPGFGRFAAAKSMEQFRTNRREVNQL